MSPPHPPTPTRRSARQKLRRSTGGRTEERNAPSSARSMKSQRVEEEPIASTSYSQPASPSTKKRKSPPAVQGKRGRRKVQAVGMQTLTASTSNLSSPTLGTSSIQVVPGKKGKRKQVSQPVEVAAEPLPEAGPSNLKTSPPSPVTPTTPTRYFTRSRSQSAPRNPRPYPYLPTPLTARSRRKTPPSGPSSLPAVSTPPTTLSALSPQSSQSDLEAADLPGLASPPPSPSSTPITRAPTRGRGRGRGTHVVPSRSPVRTRRRAKLEEELESTSSDIEMDLTPSPSPTTIDKGKGKAREVDTVDNEEDEEMAVAADLQPQHGEQQEHDENLAPSTPLPSDDVLFSATHTTTDIDPAQNSDIPDLILPIHPQSPSTSPLSPTHSSPALPSLELESPRRLGAKARRYSLSNGLVWEQDRFGTWRPRGGMYDGEAGGLWKGMWKARVSVMANELDIRSFETHNYVSQVTSQHQAPEDMDIEFTEEEMEWAYGHGVDSDDEEDDEDMDLDTDTEVQEQVGQSTLDFSASTSPVADIPQDEDENKPPPPAEPVFMEFQLNSPDTSAPTSPPQPAQVQQQQMPATNPVPRLSAIKLPELRMRDMDQFKDVFDQEVPPPSSPCTAVSPEGRNQRRNHYQSRTLGSIARGTPVIPSRRSPWTSVLSTPSPLAWGERDGAMLQGHHQTLSPLPTSLGGYAGGGEMASLDMNGGMSSMPSDGSGGYAGNTSNVLAAPVPMSNTEQVENCGLTLPNSSSSSGATATTDWQVELFTGFANMVGTAGQNVPVTIDPALQSNTTTAADAANSSFAEPIPNSNSPPATTSNSTANTGFGTDYHNSIFDMAMPSLNMNMFSDTSSSSVPEFSQWTSSSPSPEPQSPQPFLEPRMGFLMGHGAGSPPHSPPHSPSSPVGVVYS
ncbi:hypothetical protein VNI00_008126 [Paramarasmius palmivorus]|uniref:Uncharacterized protein n=1 Tax=Paramarasmius palmivorus TaxID=297713 RepID=A0AAW0CYB1_9AGAR